MGFPPVRGAIRWFRKKQSLKFQSSFEFEVIEISFTMHEVMWIRKLALETVLMGHGLVCDMRVDNQGCTKIEKSYILI